jgi:hypothetical protein
MSKANKYNCKRKYFHFIFMPKLFGEQKANTSTKKTQRQEPVMMPSISMNQGD